jgi:hypothetical protein
MIRIILISNSKRNLELVLLLSKSLAATNIEIANISWKTPVICRVFFVLVIIYNCFRDVKQKGEICAGEAAYA